MNLREAAQQALEAFELYQSEMSVRLFDSAVAALRAALAEPVQEPVAWMDIAKDGNRLSVRQWSDGNSEEVPLYTAPPKREPLTDEQIMEIFINSGRCEKTFARAIERAHGIGGKE